MFRIRTPLAAVGFAFIGAAVLFGMSLRGEATETSVVQACAHEVWPTIPAYCLTGAPQRSVRTVSVDRAEASGMADRFAADFE